MAGLDLLRRIGRIARKPPGYVVRRLAHEATMEADRVLAPALARRITGKRLATMAGVSDVDALWNMLAGRAYPAVIDARGAARFQEHFPVAAESLIEKAQLALAHEIDLLGSGPVQLGEHIDWLRDFVTGDRWPPAFCRSIDYLNKDRPSDVKRPWELSRLQWLLPIGQAFLLTGDERYAIAARDILSQWMEANPYAWSVNWSCTMEPALRILSWTWLFHIFAQSQAWSEPKFRARFLSSLYLHGAFTARHIERSTVNGNHLTADCAGLVFAGLFFADIGDGNDWATEGWRSLEHEIALQVHPDGVDFEASSAYHRLVAELFLLPARYRLARGQSVSDDYRNRLIAMADFSDTYSRPDGTSPHWGDADDGRALPLGSQPLLSDHRYVAEMIAATFVQSPVPMTHKSDGTELFWHCATLPSRGEVAAPASRSFPDGGVFVLRDRHNHVFIDCGPVGLAGLGGHGHNDALSFEAWLSQCPLIVDPGSYVYTSSFEERNAFRSTGFHNTPQIDGAEINRLHAPDNLWNLHDDARAQATAFEVSKSESRFIGHHSGYRRLAGAVRIEREIALCHDDGTLTITDRIEGDGDHEVSVPLHFAEGVVLRADGEAGFVAQARTRSFNVSYDGEPDWTASIEDARISPSYGVAVATHRLVWRKSGRLPATLKVIITPQQRCGA